LQVSGLSWVTKLGNIQKHRRVESSYPVYDKRLKT